MKIRTMAAIAAVCLAAPAAVSAQTSGTYVLEGSSYSITVQFGPGTLTVQEPNKVSEYAQVGPNEYHFTNPTNGIAYGLRVLGPDAIEAFKPGSSSPPTMLKLAGASTSLETTPEYDRLMEIAEGYAAKAESGDESPQVWATCAAVAFARATQTDVDAEWYARDAVERLKPILVSPGVNPCPEAISATIWAGN